MQPRKDVGSKSYHELINNTKLEEFMAWPKSPEVDITRTRGQGNQWRCFLVAKRQPEQDEMCALVYTLVTFGKAGLGWVCL